MRMCFERFVLALLVTFLAAGPAFAQSSITGSGAATTGLSPSGGGGGNGLGTTSGTSTTGFGKGWYPSTFQPADQVSAIFDGPNTVTGIHRSVGCGSCLVVDTSTDGGVTFQSFNTAFIAGNSITSLIKVPFTTPRYLAYVANGASSHIFSSAALTSGWADSTYAGGALIGGGFTFASKPDGTVVLSAAGTGAAVEVCKSTNQGQSFGSCVVFGAANPGIVNAVFYGGGTTWFVIDNAGKIWKSTNDGTSFVNTATVASSAGSGASGVCLNQTLAACVVVFNGAVSTSTDGGVTWVTELSTGAGGAHAVCDYGGGVVGVFDGVAPVGLSTITQTAWTSFNSGAIFYPGSVFGSNWNGAGANVLISFACNATGRGFVSIDGSAGRFLFYNPVTQPGGVLTSSAGGYQVAAPIQAGVILNAAPVVSGANASTTFPLTNTTGSRLCIRFIAVKATGAAATFTLTITDGATVILDFGTQSATLNGPADLPTLPASGVCSQTGDNLTVNIGAGGVGAVTTTSVISDRYPN